METKYISPKTGQDLFINDATNSYQNLDKTEIIL